MKNIKDNIIKNKNKIIALIFLIIFALILRDVLRKDIIVYDKIVQDFLIDKIRNDYLTKIMKGITFLGSGIPLLLICILSFLKFKDKKIKYSIPINLLVITIINNVIKILIRRPRPEGINIIIEKGFSFPSGHSMISCAFYGLIIYFINKKIENKKIKIISSLLLSLLIILIGISRVYLGVHYVSDVIGGFTVSIAYLMVFIKIMERRNVK